MSVLGETSGAIADHPILVLDQSKRYVPENAQFRNIMPVGVGAQATDLVITGSADSYSVGNNPQLIWNIPSSNDSFYDFANSYMDITVNNLNDNVTKGSLIFDNSAFGLFNKLDVQVGGVMVESINEYGAFVNTLMKTKADPNYSSFAGTAFGAGGPAASASDAHGSLATYVSSIGQKQGQTVAPSTSTKVSLPLVSGVFSQSKLYPAMFAQMQCTYYLANNGMATTGNAVNYSITNARLVLRKIQMEPAVIERMKMEMQKAGAIQLGFTGCQTFSESQNTSGNISCKADARKRSIKSVIGTLRTTANMNLITAIKHSSFIRSGTTAFQYQISGKYFPQQPIRIDSNNGGEALSHLRRCFTHLSDNRPAGVITNYSITANSHGTLADNCYFAYHFENLDGLESGINTKLSSSPITLELQRSGGDSGTRTDLFVLYDAVLTILPGGNVLLMD
jgi:hypothetical protein